jgi:hypothetical protein
LQVVDFTGKVLQRFVLVEPIGQVRWNVNQLPNGVYFYSLRSNGKMIGSGRLAVAK